MREIKFRGRDEDGQWHYGFLSWCTDVLAYICVGAEYEVEPATVGQFTELLDSAGKEIYEGDIVKTYDGSISVVIWDDATHGWREMAHDGIKCRFAPGKIARAYAVIGNVHDNPDLLEVEHDRRD